MPLDDLKERSKAIDLAVGQIEKQFGKGSIMRLGQRNAIAPIEAISTGSLKRSTTWPGACAATAPRSGEVPSSSACACAGPAAT